MKLHWNAKDITGLAFGRLTAIEQSQRRDSKGQVFWKCACSCGSEVFVRTPSLLAGDSQSCGCLQKELLAARRTIVHGQARDGHTTRTYAAWKGMLQRCLNHRSEWFHRYGGRGITVCDNWRTFQNFRADMGDCPDGLTLERLNNDGNYEPANCKWVSQKQNKRNTSRNRMLTLNGAVFCVSEWAERLSISKHTIAHRVRLGWSDDRALTEPVHPRTKR